MKRFLLTLAVMIATLCAWSAGVTITTADPEKLPEQARRFIETYFPDTRVSVIRIEQAQSRNLSYDVILENGFSLGFDRRGAWTDVDGQGRPLPPGIVPSSITEYLSGNFPDRTVVSAKRDKNGYGLGLSDGTGLGFDQQDT